MHTSEAFELDSTGKTYWDALRKFSHANLNQNGIDGVFAAYHTVRNLPYHSSADRSPLTALKHGRGACTAKHIILRDLIRNLGFKAQVELVDGDFSLGVPLDGTQPPQLTEFIRLGGIRDIHCWIRAELEGHTILLDATWPDCLEKYGFRVNSGWNELVDTLPALSEFSMSCFAENVIAAKTRLLENFTREEQMRRTSFLRLLTKWMLEITQIETKGKTDAK